MTPVTEKARRYGELQAHQEAFKTVEALKKWGGALLVLLLLTSAFHLFVVLAGVGQLSDLAHYAGAALQVLSIDATALYLVLARGALHTTGRDTATKAVWYFLSLTAALNAVFLLSFTASLPSWAVDLRPAASSIAVSLLIVFFLVAVAAVERARDTLNEARLDLLVDMHSAQVDLGLVSSFMVEVSDVRTPAASEAPKQLEAPSSEAKLSLEEVLEEEVLETNSSLEAAAISICDSSQHAQAPGEFISCRVAGCDQTFKTKAAERAHQRAHRR